MKVGKVTPLFFSGTPSSGLYEKPKITPSTQWQKVNGLGFA